MISLEIIGALKKARTFENELDIRKVKRMMLSNPDYKVLLQENIKELEKKGDNPQLLKALYKVINRPRWQIKLKKKLKKFNL